MEWQGASPNLAMEMFVCLPSDYFLGPEFGLLHLNMDNQLVQCFCLTPKICTLITSWLLYIKSSVLVDISTLHLPRKYVWLSKIFWI